MTPPSTTSRTLLANARILAFDGDRDERPFDGDILIEGRRIARVSHGRLGIDPAGTRVADLGAATVGSDDADAYLSGDILQAAAARHLTRIRPGHTVVVVDPELTPTAAMLQGGSAPPDIEALKAAIERAASPATAESPATRVAFVAAKRIAEAVFSDHLLANVILAGASYQLGGPPGSLDDVAQAMSRQGKSAAVNREAFEWGRWAVHDPDAVEAALRGLARVARGDDGEHGWELTRAVTMSWFGLLTYKDEYEVARLHLAFDYDADARHLGIEGRYTLKYHLHPPALRRLGLKHKLPMGKPYALAFQVLARMKRLRGTPLDVFGWDPDRRLERTPIGEYEQLIEGAGDLPYDDAVRLAQSVKGYAQVKEAAVTRWRPAVAALLDHTPDPVRAGNPQG
jgi:indolepyruvate ferredoxin oxidoreductase